MMKSKEKIKTNRKVVFLILVAVIAALVISGIVALTNLLSKEVVAGNIANMGLAIEKDGVIYYNKYEDGIVKVKRGKEYQITDETAYSMNIVDDTIYYLTVSNLNTIDIKSVKTNGDGLKKIKTISTTVSKIYVQDGYIYYATNKDDNGIVKLNLKTEEETKIVKANIQDFVVDGNMIYFTDNVNTLSSVTTSGLNVKLLTTTGKVQKIQVLKNWIYYYDSTEDALCKVKKDGTSKKVVSTFVNNEMYNVTSKRIYFYDDINRAICSSDINGKTSKIVVSISSTKPKINIVDGIMYYLDDSKNETQIYQMYRIKTNGGKTDSIEY